MLCHPHLLSPSLGLDPQCFQNELSKWGLLLISLGDPALFIGKNLYSFVWHTKSCVNMTYSRDITHCSPTFIPCSTHSEDPRVFPELDLFCFVPLHVLLCLCGWSSSPHSDLFKTHWKHCLSWETLSEPLIMINVLLFSLSYLFEFPHIPPPNKWWTSSKFIDWCVLNF